jgi:hypothetical protein
MTAVTNHCVAEIGCVTRSQIMIEIFYFSLRIILAYRLAEAMSGYNGR